VRRHNSHLPNWGEHIEMTKTKQKPVVRRIQKIDVSILLGLYKLRALSTDQIRRRYNLKPAYVYKKLEILRNTGWIITEPISGYTNKQRRQGSYHRISETGITCLKKQGYPVERVADDLRVNKRFLPYLLSANDIFVDLEPFGWTMQDSREVKRKYNMNRGDSLQGIFTSPKNKEYIFYVLKESTTERTLAKIAKEIESHSKVDRMQTNRPTSNYIIFVRGQKSYEQVVNTFYNDKDVLTTTQQLKVMPSVFAKMYFRLFYDEVELINYLIYHGISDVTRQVFPKLTKSYKGLSTIVKHKGNEKYLLNLLDSDLIKIHDVHSYRKEQYQLDGKKILAITTNALLKKHQEMLRSIKHIDWYPIDHHEIIDYLNEVTPTSK